MYALIAKCEELSRTMVPVDDLAKQMYPLMGIVDMFIGEFVYGGGYPRTSSVVMILAKCFKCCIFAI